MNVPSNNSFRRRLRLVVLAACAPLVLGSGGLAASAATPPLAPAAAAAASGAVVRSHIQLVGTTRPAPLAKAGVNGVSPGSTAPARVMPLLRPQHPKSAFVRGTRTVPQATGQARAARNGGAPAIVFDGVNAIQNKRVAGFDLEPPDEGLGAGNGYVANFVNVTGAIYRTDGSVVTRPFYLNSFFHEAAAANLSDPRVYYDPTSRAWFATMVEYALDGAGNITESHVDIAVSKTANPAGDWRIYRIPTSSPSHGGCPCLADYPILGVSRTNVYVSTNEFTSDEQGFNGAQLYALSKSQLLGGRKSVNMATFEDLSAGGAQGYHVQPANTVQAAPAEYLLSSLDPNSTSDHRLAVWAVTNEASVTSGRGMPALSVRVINSEGYAFPPNAQTPPGFCNGSRCKGGVPTTGVVQTDFDAMQEVQYINGQLVGALNTAVTVPGDTAERSGVAWFVVAPRLNGAALSARTSITRQGYVATNGQYLMYPHINMTSNGAMALVFGLGGPATYLSAAYTVAPAGRGFGAIKLAAAGTGPDNGFTGTDKYGGAGRWGDYSNGEIIPGTNRVWLATQYIPNSGDGNANWGNAIFELRLP